MRQDKRFLCSAILLDMDGVLLDSSSNVQRRWTEWAKKHELDVEEVVRLTNGFSTQQIVRSFFSGQKAEDEINKMDYSAAVDLDGVHLAPGAEFFNQIPERMRAVVTSASRETAIARLTHVGLQVPQVLVGSDNVETRKPSSEPYDTAIKDMGISKRLGIAIEDSAVGIKSAVSAGLATVKCGATDTNDYDVRGVYDAHIPDLTYVSLLTGLNQTGILICH